MSEFIEGQYGAGAISDSEAEDENSRVSIQLICSLLLTLNIIYILFSLLFHILNTRFVIHYNDLNSFE